jgi:glycosyltransferase involved in cell wall biosynthesis
MQMQQPMVSVLMTAYNREKFIHQAIDSVLASTYQNFELIIVDDGSKDDTVKIAKSYADKDTRIRVFVNEKNLGDYPNRNKAASYARGKYIKYLDSDDYIYPGGLETLIVMMEKFPAAGWGLCSLDQNVKQPFPFQLSPEEAYIYHYLGTGLFSKAPLSAIIKKDVFDRENGFKAIRMAGDFEMWQRLAQKYPVVAMPHGVVWYREHHAQEVNDYRKFIEVYESLKFQFLRDKQCPLKPEIIEQVIKQENKRAQKQILLGFLFMDKNRVMDNFLRLRIGKNAE